jgi:hypothetical protein
MADFSITGFLAGLGEPKSDRKAHKSRKKGAIAEEPEPAAPRVEDNSSAAVLASAFQPSDASTGPQLVPAAAVSSKSKKRRHSIDDVLQDLASGTESEEEKETSGRRSKKRVVAKDSAEKLARTVYVGNLCSTIKPKEIKRLMNAVLAGRNSPLDDLIKPPTAETEATEDGDEDNLPDLDELSEGDISDDDESDAEANSIAKTFQNAVESVRLRSVPVTGTRVASGSSYKVMKKVNVFAVPGWHRSSGSDVLVGHVVYRRV